MLRRQKDEQDQADAEARRQEEALQKQEDQEMCQAESDDEDAATQSMPGMIQLDDGNDADLSQEPQQKKAKAWLCV